MQARQDNTQTQQQTQKIGPHLIHANWLLQCSNTELAHVIEQERLENPALDSDVTSGNVGCGQCPRGDASLCTFCPYARGNVNDIDGSIAGPDGDHGRDSFSLEDHSDDDIADLHDDNRSGLDAHFDSNTDNGPNGPDGPFDPLLLVAAHTNLTDTLLAQLRASIRAPDILRVAEYIANCLDEHGYFTADPIETCAILDVNNKQIDEALLHVHACEPAGIGARNLRECLLLQIRHIRDTATADETYDAVAESLLDRYWEPFIQRRTGPLPRKLGVTPERLDAAIAFIRTRLVPRPATGYRQPWENNRDSLSIVVRPDVIIHRTTSGFTVEVVGQEGQTLQVNPYYRGLYDTIRGDKRQAPVAKDAPPSPRGDHAKHVIAYVERANLFLTNLQRRRRTIQRIADAIVEIQQGFLHTGQKAFLRPLTRTDLAQNVGIHESTISRALLHKFVQLPTQEVVPFDFFFGRTSNARDIIAELVDAENPQEPLSDQALVNALKEKGLTLARRTVVKYRDELRIPASYLRRRR